MNVILDLLEISDNIEDASKILTLIHKNSGRLWRYAVSSEDAEDLNLLKSRIVSALEFFSARYGPFLNISNSALDDEYSICHIRLDIDRYINNLFQKVTIS